jgi:hypothetical protein
MIITKENRQDIIYLLTGFYNHITEMEDKTYAPMKIIEPFVDDQINMYKAMSEHYDNIRLDNEKNHRLLRAIKKVKGKTFYKYLTEIIYDSEGIKGLAEIVSKPTGKYQEEPYGRTIKGMWIEQWTVGMEPDSYVGTVCIQLKPNKYLKFNYSM